MSHHFQELGIL